MTDWLLDCPRCHATPTVVVVVDDAYGFQYPRCGPCAAALVRVLTTRHPEIPFHQIPFPALSEAAA